ncbi:MAG: FHA domain-containing protein [Anaerolineae bacterium]|nr:FHA domain-containing protein [Anaerolineae bacterium]
MHTLRAQATRLSEEQRHELGSMIGAWETREGKMHRPDSQAEPPVRPGPPPAESVTCPNCGKANHKREYYCYACGHILTTAPATKKLGGDFDALDPDVRWGTSYFDQSMAVILEPRDGGAALTVEPKGDQEVVIGRSSRDSIMLPDVDLAPYRADAYGVSRLHATLRCRGDTIVISDLGSSNHTFINGQRLHPHELRCLREGDELRLGHLVMKVHFQRRPARRA